MITYTQIRDHRQWKSTVGLGEKEFTILANLFGKSYEKLNGISLSDKALNLNQELPFTTYKECLFFVLFYLRNPVVFDTLGFMFDTNSSVVQKNLNRLLPILEATLQDQNMMPKRQFKDIEEFTNFLDGTDEITFDATEIAIQRPANYQKQKEFYSGKKKRHTVKNLLITNSKKVILYLGKTVKGKEHDFSILKNEFPSSIPWFEGLKVRLDLGFQGFENIYKTIKTYIPAKRKRAVKGKKSELTQEQKEYNKSIGKERVVVEHSIGGMKRYRIILERLRFKRIHLIDKISGICAGLWNFTLSFKF